jgi:protein phosphatase
MLRVDDSASESDTGRQRRSNEDRKLERAPLFVVADGMGGARAGEVASGMVIDLFEQGLPDGGDDAQRLVTLIEEANRRIHDRATSDHDRAGMGTTITVAYVGEDLVTIAHVGDSRAYRHREGEPLERLTRDHSLVEELVRRGKLTEEEAENHPQKSVITRAVGPEGSVEVDTSQWTVRDGDVFLLCSDGLTGMVDDRHISNLISAAPSLRDAAETLVRAANDAGGRDNITVVLFRVGVVDAPGAGDSPTATGEDAEATMLGSTAPTTAEVADALAARDAAGDDPPTATVPRRTAPLPPRPAGDDGGKRRRRGRRGARPALAVMVVAALLLAGGWIASRAVYFVGTDHGFVTVFQGLPYELPGGVKLYQPEYTSGVPASELPANRRKTLLDHTLRSRKDAADLVRKLELGQVQ